MKYDIYAFGIMASVISFLGFVVENVWLYITKGYINNRNMNAPFLLGYGLLILVLYFVVGTPNNMVLPKSIRGKLRSRGRYLLYFILAMIVVCVGEIVLGEVVERLCCFEYWNYENIPFHITKYTSLPTSAAFAAMITFFMGVCFEPMMTLIHQIDPRWMKIISVTLVTIMLADFFASFGIMIKRKDFFLKWKIVFRK